MKENKYDNEEFFKKYSVMNRSVNGLKGAGEWSELQKVLPDFEGLRVLDLGCGYGWHCLYAAQNGAKSVLGVDISKRMLKSAMEKNSHERITYRQSAMEDLDFPDGSFNAVISSLAFHYVKDFEPLVGSISRWLVPGGGCWSSRRSTLSLRLTVPRTGIMQRMAAFFISRWTIIIMKGNGMLSFWVKG